MHQLGPVSEAPSHIWHLINLHRADIALAGRPWPGAPGLAPLAWRPYPPLCLCSIEQPSVAPAVASKPLAAVARAPRARLADTGAQLLASSCDNILPITIGSSMLATIFIGP